MQFKWKFVYWIKKRIWRKRSLLQWRLKWIIIFLRSLCQLILLSFGRHAHHTHNSINNWYWYWFKENLSKASTGTYHSSAKTYLYSSKSHAFHKNYANRLSDFICIVNGRDDDKRNMQTSSEARTWHQSDEHCKRKTQRCTYLNIFYIPIHILYLVR